MNEDSNQDSDNGLNRASKQDSGDELSEDFSGALSESFADATNQAFDQAFLPGLT